MNGQENMIIGLEKRPHTKTKLRAPEEFFRELADKDLEELY